MTINSEQSVTSDLPSFSDDPCFTITFIVRIGLATLITAVRTTTSTPPSPLHHYHYKYHQLKQHQNIITFKTNHWCKINREKNHTVTFYSSNKALSQLWKGIFGPKSKCPMSWLFLLDRYRLFRQNGLFLVLVLGLGGAERRFSL